MKTDLAWLAGFFDGEGCVSLRIDDNIAHQPRVTITQFGDEGYETLLEVKRIVGFGSICRSKRGYNQYRLTSYTNCFLFCGRILPYSIRKKKVIGMMLEFCVELKKELKYDLGLKILKTHGRKGKRRWSK